MTTTPRATKRRSSRAALALGTFFLFIFSMPSASAAGLESGVVPMPVFLLIGGVAVLFIVLGLAVSQPWILILGSALGFLAGFIIETGNLGLRLTQDASYTAWSGANHHLLGWSIMVFGVVFFAMALLNLGGDDEF